MNSKSQTHSPRLRLETNVAINVLKHALQKCGRRFRNQVKLEYIQGTGPQSIGWSGIQQCEPGTVASIISLAITLWLLARDSRSKKRWTRKKIQLLLEEELVYYGVVDVSLESIYGYRNLFGTGLRPCYLVVRDAHSDRRFRATIWSDGDIKVTVLD